MTQAAPAVHKRSLLGIEHLAVAEIKSILRLAGRMNPDRPRPLLKNRRIALLFYETSTRTRISFEFAAKALGATTTLVQATGSSIEKGESSSNPSISFSTNNYYCVWNKSLFYKNWKFHIECIHSSAFHPSIF